MADEPVRILEISEDKLTAEQKKVFDDLVAGRGRLLTPYKIWIHSPKLAAAMETIGTFLNKKGSLTERAFETCTAPPPRLKPSGAKMDKPTILKEILYMKLLLRDPK